MLVRPATLPATALLSGFSGFLGRSGRPGFSAGLLGSPGGPGFSVGFLGSPGGAGFSVGLPGSPGFSVGFLGSPGGPGFSAALPGWPGGLDSNLDFKALARPAAGIASVDEAAAPPLDPCRFFSPCDSSWGFEGKGGGLDDAFPGSLGALAAEDAEDLLSLLKPLRREFKALARAADGGRVCSSSSLSSLLSSLCSLAAWLPVDDDVCTKWTWGRI